MQFPFNLTALPLTLNSHLAAVGKSDGGRDGEGERKGKGRGREMRKVEEGFR